MDVLSHEDSCLLSVIRPIAEELIDRYHSKEKTDLLVKEIDQTIENVLNVK